jgi:ferredoxin
MDKIGCAKYHDGLAARFCAPCGVCANVCPVGADLRLHPAPFVTSAASAMSELRCLPAAAKEETPA